MYTSLYAINNLFELAYKDIRCNLKGSFIPVKQIQINENMFTFRKAVSKYGKGIKIKRKKIHV